MIHKEVETVEAPVPSELLILLSEGKQEGHRVSARLCIIIAGWTSHAPLGTAGRRSAATSRTTRLRRSLALALVVDVVDPLSPLSRPRPFPPLADPLS